jgi:hypothetical protein
MSNPGPEIIHIGRHVVELHPPDRFILRLVGDTSVAEVMQVFDAMEVFGEGTARFYWVMDLSRMGAVPPDVRLQGGLRPLPASYVGLVFFGGNFQQRLVARLAALAGALLRRRKSTAVFLENEAEAHAWVAAQGVSR